MRLCVETGPSAGTAIVLERDHQVLLGSGADCALRIDEPGVAAQHAVVKALRDQGFGIKALQPGLRLNGAEVEASPLREGDVIELGTTRISYGKGAAAGPRVAGFKLLGELGKGGMGIVYRAEQVSLHREVALKVLSRELTKDPQFVAKFVAEARAAAKLQHPNVVQVFDVDHDGDIYYYAMELMHEGSLEGWLKKNGVMPVERALQVVADAGAGLAYAESLGIVHRDIKPDNLMLDHHGTVKIADLGLAHTDADPEEKLSGTPHFMAPEQVLRKGADHRADLYALGCTFYRLVTGKTPFRGQSVKDILRAHVKDEAEPAHKANPEVPLEVTVIIQKLMAKDPALRYQSATELVTAVQALLQPAAKKGLWIGLAAAAVVVAGGAIFWAVTRPKEHTIVEKYRDNPEALRLATENEQLKGRAHEDQATIALLRTQLRGLLGAELAAAYEQLAKEHAGTAAAQQAQQLARGVREQQQQQELARQQRAELVTAAANLLQQEVQTALGKGDFAGALKLLDREVAPDVAADASWPVAITGLRQRIVQQVQAELAQRRQTLDAALQQKDAVAAGAAIERLAAAIDDQTGWPRELLPDRKALQRLLDDARAQLQTHATERVDERWHGYRALLAGDAGVFAHIVKFDFAGGAAALQGFAAPDGDAPAIAAARLAAALQQAALMAQLLEQGADKLQLPAANGGQQPLVRCRFADGALVLLDASKRPPRELPLLFVSVTAEQWDALAGQVAQAPPGSRESFAAFVLLAEHARSATGYLGRLNQNADDSGTGTTGYTLGSAAFDAQLRRLPADSHEDWCQCLRQELSAGNLLAAGLRALSERRNLAAAADLDRLVQQHAHSLLVAVLP
ncbi:MAG TPA: FHA domain-containing serine/threonine-protein kinase [Planctomycetota bacterium]|nr:FHA domain-containing serine/threonine-protein kinase [Planctomycetota bacterium]